MLAHEVARALITTAALSSLVLATSCNLRKRAVTNDDAGASSSSAPASPSASTSARASARRGKTHAEIKGSIRHAHGDGPRTEEAGGKGELDPINGMWGSGPNDVYAAAWDDPGKGLLHSKGDGHWTHEDVHERRLFAVWGSSASDVYVAGTEGVIHHGRAGGPWKREHEGSRGATRGLWGSGPKDLYAVGAYGEILRSKGDGKWTEAGLSDTHALLLCVWGSGPNDVYVAGNDGEIFHSAGNGKWTPQNLPEKETVWGIFGVGPKEIYAAADKLYRSSGDGTWVAVDVPGLDGAKSVFADARGTLWIGARDGKLFVRKNGVWSHTQDAHAGSYQALWASGDDLYIGAERFLEWTDPE